MTFRGRVPSQIDFLIDMASQNRNRVKTINAARLKGDGVGWSKRGSETGGTSEPFLVDFGSCSTSDSSSVRSLSEPMSLSESIRGSFSSIAEALAVDIVEGLNDRLRDESLWERRRLNLCKA
jgi:hypothetical protein